MALLFPFLASAQHNLSVGVTVDIDTANIGASRTLTVTVYNQGGTTVTGVHLSTVFTSGLTAISGTTSAGTYAANDWNIGTISAATASVTLTRTTTASTESVQTLTAQISAMNETDGDSSPNNNDLKKDDLKVGCLSVPIYYCDGATINLTATATAGMTYQWYKNGTLILSESNQTYTITAIGSYTYTATSGSLGTCSGSTCCPIIVRYVPTPALSTTPVTICTGSSTDLTLQVTDNNSTTGTTTFYLTLADATAQTNALASLTVSPTTTTTYYVRKNTSTTPSCNDIKSILVTVNSTVTAGTGTNPANICQAGSGIAPLNLDAQITGQTIGGKWSQIANAAPTVGTALNTTTGALNLNGLAVGTHVFRYTVKATAPCPSDTEGITVIIEACCPAVICLPVTVVRN